jgi:hypothetical protein
VSVSRSAIVRHSRDSGHHFSFFGRQKTRSVGIGAANLLVRTCPGELLVDLLPVWRRHDSVKNSLRRGSPCSSNDGGAHRGADIIV